MKRVILTGVVCLLLGAAVDRLLVWGSVSQPATGTKPTYTMPNNEPGQYGNGQPSKDRLGFSPRHGENIEIKMAGKEKPLKAFIVHPERADKAPVVLVIMEIYGMSDWLKATTDQLAADGFIAIAPDFTSLKEGATASSGGNVTQGITAADVIAECNAARDYGLKLPNANGKSASVGFCWGGGMSFSYAAAQPDLNAAVVFYGTPPADDQLAKIKAPVAGFYGGNDARITSTVAPTTEKMKTLGKSYDPHVYEGAGHGFMRGQSAGANEKAAKEAWPLVIKFLKDNTKAETK
ncbi:MAG TPA: dienelactone hydrolase family protein [Phycisphaerae bacterium]|nr:dienelactone hydrolase family protein [Phycisphaerae bacterium]